MSINFTENAKIVLSSRYLLKDSKGTVLETPEDLFFRVSSHIASIESVDKKKWENKFYEMMSELRFLPNTPTLINSGKKNGQLSACFVLPLKDSLEEIFSTLKKMALIQQSGGGTGFSFSQLRSKGEEVENFSGRPAAGPVAFLRIFHTTSETIKQGGVRSGANMAVLKYNHPDILDFIELKSKHGGIESFNLSVGLDRDFFKALKLNKKIELIDPTTHKMKGSLDAHFILDKIAQSSWSCGDPGLIFLDRVNFFNPTPNLGDFESTNPCGEQPLLSYESCNLGSLNLVRYWKKNSFDWSLFIQDIHTAVRFLDNVIDVNYYPVDECQTITKKNRKIGLGIMGLADLFLKMKIAYGSSDSLEISEKIARILFCESKKASHFLAVGKKQEKGRGAFHGFSKSLWKKLNYPLLRNATTTTVAPTGSISLIAGVSSGIEPVFSGMFYRHVLSGKILKEEHFLWSKAVLESKNKELASLLPNEVDLYLSNKYPHYWKPAHKVSSSEHLKIQAVFQRYSDSAVSKTINLPTQASVEDVKSIYLNAYSFGCKGITVFRDQSKNNEQVLSSFVSTTKKPQNSKFECEDC